MCYYIFFSIDHGYVQTIGYGDIDINTGTNPTDGKKIIRKKFYLFFSFLRGSPPPQKIDFFFTKIDFEISTYTESPKCPLSDYVRFIAL